MANISQYDRGVLSRLVEVLTGKKQEAASHREAEAKTTTLDALKKARKARQEAEDEATILERQLQKEREVAAASARASAEAQQAALVAESAWEKLKPLIEPKAQRLAELLAEARGLALEIDALAGAAEEKGAQAKRMALDGVGKLPFAPASREAARRLVRAAIAAVAGPAFDLWAWLKPPTTPQRIEVGQESAAEGRARRAVAEELQRREAARLEKLQAEQTGRDPRQYSEVG